jgi:kynureninase
LYQGTTLVVPKPSAIRQTALAAAPVMPGLKPELFRLLTARLKTQSTRRKVLADGRQLPTDSFFHFCNNS